MAKYSVSSGLPAVSPPRASQSTRGASHSALSIQTLSHAGPFTQCDGFGETREIARTTGAAEKSRAVVTRSLVCRGTTPKRL
jgi:hypothetical protein